MARHRKNIQNLSNTEDEDIIETVQQTITKTNKPITLKIKYHTGYTCFEETEKAESAISSGLAVLVE